MSNKTSLFLAVTMLMSVNEWKIFVAEFGAMNMIQPLTNLHLYNPNYSLDIVFNKE
jgi:hypothetical protein